MPRYSVRRKGKRATVVDRDELADRRDGLVQALTERSKVVQTFDTGKDDEDCEWEAPTLVEAERIADFVIEYLAGADAD